MLQMIKGCKIRDSALLSEGYEKISTGFVANVDADKIQILFENFVKLHNEDCFIILELPTNRKDEEILQPEGITQLHKDVYYLDGLTPQQACEFLNVFAPWLIHDGLSSFGIGLHSGSNEIMREKYNVITVYTKDQKQYHDFFETIGINRVRKLKTAWDFFTADTPGDSFAYVHNGENIYELLEHLKQYGLYFAERRNA